MKARLKKKKRFKKKNERGEKINGACEKMNGEGEKIISALPSCLKFKKYGRISK